MSFALSDGAEKASGTDGLAPDCGQRANVHGGAGDFAVASQEGWPVVRAVAAVADAIGDVLDYPVVVPRLGERVRVD